jgi:hypothetical protein
MDPYLEKRNFWPDFHHELISNIRENLQGQIRPTYNARIEERIHLIKPPQDYYPDVSIIRPPQKVREAVAQYGSAVIADEPYLVKALESEFRESYIEIIYLPTGEVVTTIEVISPINKVGQGRDKYLGKQEQILSSETNLVEIDLLRMGSHVVAVPEARVSEVAGWRYLVSVKRANHFGEYEVYFIELDSRLPRCGIPLKEPDKDAVLDLPAVFDRTYEVSGFEDFIDYRERPPEPELSEKELGWLEGLLREKGLRETAE